MAEPEVKVEATPEAAPAPEQKMPSREELVAKIKEGQEQQFAQTDRAFRLAKARKGYRAPVTNPETGKTRMVLQFLHPSVEPSDAELREMLPLDTDRLNYGWENEKKGTKGVVALNRYGLYAMPKPQGRRKPHMTKKQQGVKSYSIIAFRSIFEQRIDVLKAEAEKKGETFLGIPESELSKIAAKAAVIGQKNFHQMRYGRRVTARRHQDFSRKVNAGVLQGNFGERNYVHAGGEYGR